MKKHKPIQRWQVWFFVSALFAGHFFIFKTFAHAADDNLSSFQQEILSAKQKQQVFSNKIESVDLALNDQRSKELQSEAEKLMSEVSQKGYSASANEIRKEEVRLAPPAAPKKAAANKKIVAGKKFLPWLGLNFGSYGEDGKPSDAETLYKVAVSDNKITLKEAVEIGLSGNVQLQANKKKVEVAEAKLVEARRALFPTVQATADVNGGHISNRFYRGKSYKINANQPLFYGGELVLTAKQAEESVKTAKAEYEKVKNELTHQIRVLYYGVVKAEYNVQYQFEVYEKISPIYKKVREAHGQKLIPEVDYLNAESQYQQVYFQMELARNDLLTATVLLSQVLNLDPAESLPIDLKLKFAKLDLGFDKMLEVSLRNNPDIRLRQYALQSAQYGVDIYQARKFPRFDLRGSYGNLGEIFRDTTALQAGNADLDTEKEWFLGVHGSMPIGPNSIEYDQVKHVFGPTVSAFQGSDDWRHHVVFNLFDKLSDVTDAKQAQAAFLQAQADFKKTRDDTGAKLREDFYNLQKSLIQIDSAAAKVRYQEKQNAVLEYLLGMQETSPANLFEGLIEAAQDKFSFIQAATDYHVSVSSLSVSLGDPDYFDRYLA